MEDKIDAQLEELMNLTWEEKMKMASHRMEESMNAILKIMGIKKTIQEAIAKEKSNRDITSASINSQDEHNFLESNILGGPSKVKENEDGVFDKIPVQNSDCDYHRQGKTSNLMAEKPFESILGVQFTKPSIQIEALDAVDDCPFFLFPTSSIRYLVPISPISLYQFSLYSFFFYFTHSGSDNSMGVVNKNGNTSWPVKVSGFKGGTQQLVAHTNFLNVFIVKVDFWRLFLVYLIAVGSGAQIGRARGVQNITLLLCLFSFLNFVGQLGGVVLSENFVRSKTMPRTIWITCMQVMMIFTYLLFASAIDDILSAATALLGICYGVQFSIMVPTTSEAFWYNSCSPHELIKGRLSLWEETVEDDDLLQWKMCKSFKRNSSTVLDIQFRVYSTGLKLVAAYSDGQDRIFELLDPLGMKNWQL